MIVPLYAALLVIFGGLIALALVSYSVRRGALVEELEETRDRLARREAHLQEMREEMDELAVEIDLLELEKRSLEAQENCMKGLDQFEAAGETESEETC